MSYTRPESLAELGIRNELLEQPIAQQLSDDSTTMGAIAATLTATDEERTERASKFSSPEVGLTCPA